LLDSLLQEKMSAKSKKSKKKNAKPDVPVVKKSKTILKRKQLRQEKKLAKKKSKQDFFQKKFQTSVRSAEHDEEIPSSGDEEGTEEPQRKKVKFEEPPTKSANTEVNKKTNKELKELNRQQKKQRKRQLTLANVEEMKNIKQLEKQLGMKKRKSKNLPKCFLDDGLDYILDACDSAKLEAMGDLSEEEEGEERNRIVVAEEDSEEDEDLIEGVDYDFESDGDGSQHESEDGDGSEEEGENEDCEEYESTMHESEEESINDKVIDESNIEEANEMDSAVESSEDLPKVWEDIYGRKRDSEGNVIKADHDADTNKTIEPSKYIPPAMRNKVSISNESEEKKIALARLAKQLKGLLNRLAESNMHGIARDIEGFYRQFSRNDVNKTLTDLLMNSLVSTVNTPIRLVMEHVMLLAILHANVGTEVGAHVLQIVTKTFSSHHDSSDDILIEDKTTDNLLLIICYMYSFKIVGAKLVFDILDKLCENFSAKDIDLVLVTLRNCGFVLRKDDPTSLKTLILKIQSLASKSKEEDTRVNFMLEVLMAIKNNNVNKIPNYDPSHFEHLKKCLKTHLREGNFVTELKIGFADLALAESRGRWWIVGSAFTGELAGGKDEKSDTRSGVGKEQQYSDKLLDLARKMRMNTDTRRNIFCIIMTAEDFMDGAEKLVKLGTKNQMEREVVFVLTDCCMQEMEFNPYYAHLANRLAHMDRKYRLATQFHIWDRLKQVKDMKKFQLGNLAKFTMFLIKEKAQSLGVLKVIEFAEMNKPNVKFLRTVLTGVLMDQEEELVAASFKAISEQANLNFFRESLRLFMHHFMLKQSKEVDLIAIRRRISIAEKALMSSSSKLRL